MVELDEGPRLMTDMVGMAPEDLEVGMAVQVDFRAITDDIDATVFRPADARHRLS